MGTKLEPGQFDCHAAALPDEPMFVLLARDPLAAFLVSIWSSVRLGDGEAAGVKFDTMMTRAAPRFYVEPDIMKAGEAIDCAMAMFEWRKANEGRWRDPRSIPQFSADAEYDGIGINVRLYASTDPGPAREFRPIANVTLGEAHATELLGTLMIALDKMRGE